MQIAFWGVRGSFPVCQAQSLRYGGNTPCLEVDAGEAAILIDAGTGIRAAGRALAKRGVREIHLLLSHAHWDHIQGFPYFAPLHQPGTSVRIYSLRRPGTSLRAILADQQRNPFFPVALEELPAQLEFVELEEGQVVAIGDTRVYSRRLNHPSLTGGFRLERQGRSFAYLSDVDLYTKLLLGAGLQTPSAAERQQRLKELLAGACDLAHCADLAVCDTFFRPEDYEPSWGHSRPEDALRLARDTGVGQLVLFHHEPHRSDGELDELLAHYRRQAGGALELIAAAEGLALSL
ncbi:MAG: MBL fold metallo-hydrolase [Candidatus Latescibacteria bacterium]|nr:MBL fold metallo-hydrolase [Candidatus Latescibacterota bacterium]